PRPLREAREPRDAKEAKPPRERRDAPAKPERAPREPRAKVDAPPANEAALVSAVPGSEAPHDNGNGDERRDGGRRRRGRRGRGGERADRPAANAAQPANENEIREAIDSRTSEPSQARFADHSGPDASVPVASSHGGSVESVPIDIAAIPVQVAPASSERAIARTHPSLEPVASAAGTSSHAHDSAMAFESMSRPTQNASIGLELPPDSGLEMIETRPHERIEAPPPSEPRQRRARPPRAIVADEPLQMVETRREGDSAD
ncbi:MAG TPA: hypothetical protein VNG69_16250, partial [Casimicrobiaceae bacterium]|nr:hypothetical protein [Casimicrobiaceae bacterium]